METILLKTQENAVKARQSMEQAEKHANINLKTFKTYKRCIYY